MSGSDCNEKYPQVGVSTYCLARTYQQIIAISMNYTIKLKLRSVYQDVPWPIWIPEYRKQQNKKKYLWQNKTFLQDT